MSLSVCATRVSLKVDSVVVAKFDNVHGAENI